MVVSMLLKYSERKWTKRSSFSRAIQWPPEPSERMRIVSREASCVSPM